MASRQCHTNVDVTSFLWAVFAADLGYVFLAAFQRWFSGSYPAPRHRVDRVSIVTLAVHMLCGSAIIWGGCALWLALQADWTPTVPAWAATALGIVTLLHCASNLPLLRKIPRPRLLNVPLYLMVTTYNARNALVLLDATPLARERAFLLLWCGVSTFVWVRFFFALFVLVTISSLQDAGSYDLFYSVSLPYACIFGIVIPIGTMGDDTRWFAGFAAIAAVAPLMIILHKTCVATLAHPQVQTSPLCRFLLQSIVDATNPVQNHGQAVPMAPSPPKFSTS